MICMTQPHGGPPCRSGLAVRYGSKSREGRSETGEARREKKGENKGEGSTRLARPIISQFSTNLQRLPLLPPPKTPPPRSMSGRVESEYSCYVDPPSSSPASSFVTETSLLVLVHERHPTATINIRDRRRLRKVEQRGSSVVIIASIVLRRRISLRGSQRHTDYVPFSMSLLSRIHSSPSSAHTVPTLRPLLRSPMALLLHIGYLSDSGWLTRPPIIQSFVLLGTFQIILFTTCS